MTATVRRLLVTVALLAVSAVPLLLLTARPADTPPDIPALRAVAATPAALSDVADDGDLLWVDMILAFGADRPLYATEQPSWYAAELDPAGMPLAPAGWAAVEVDDGRLRVFHLGGPVERWVVADPTTGRVLYSGLDGQRDALVELGLMPLGAAAALLVELTLFIPAVARWVESLRVYKWFDSTAHASTGDGQMVQLVALIFAVGCAGVWAWTMWSAFGGLTV